MIIELKKLSLEMAKEIVSWRYPNEYSVYNLPSWDEIVTNNWGLSSPIKREKEFFSIILNQQFIGYTRFSKRNDRIWIGIGLKPSYCGKGHGKKVMELIVGIVKVKYPEVPIALQVRVFNKRAISAYKSIGFKHIKQYKLETKNGVDTFLYMEYIPNDLEYIRRIINRWDPIDLLAHAPDDEYAKEVSLIYNVISKKVTEKTLATQIYNIFLDSFGKSVFNKSYDDCLVVSKHLLA